MRIALGIEYDGSGFCGWQRQDNAPSIQAAVEKALAKVADRKIQVICAGRTDTGVHALGQVIHFDTTVVRDQRSWLRGCNANLPNSVAATWIRPVKEDFHARFSAQSRRYRYIIFNRDIRPTFLAGRVTWDYRPLDTVVMAEAAQHLVGVHDFSAYRAAGCQANTAQRDVRRITVSRNLDLVFVDIQANAFLQHMVRNIVGVLSSIGAKEKPPAWSREVLETRDRRKGGITAPADGLYLVDIDYGPEFGLPQVSETQMIW
jgi:tRNA pseudouridine38-40 synthase